VRNSRAFAQAGGVKTELHVGLCADTKRTHLVSNNPRFSKGDAKRSRETARLEQRGNCRWACEMDDLSVALIARALEAWPIS